MALHFTKMSGAGNDFVVIDNRNDGVSDKPALAKKICDRHWGVGADGLLLLEKGSKADYRMAYYNADGSYGGMCGNGGRCIAAYAVARGIASTRHEFEALDHRYKAEVSGDRVTLWMKNPTDLRRGIVLPVSFGTLTCHSVDTGAPHVVIFSDENGFTLTDVDVEGLGREVRLHKEFSPAGTNVNFVHVSGRNSIEIRTYERGVESETLACGTGSIASAILSAFVKGTEIPVEVLVKSGEKLRVAAERVSGEFRNIELTGPAVEVFEGSIAW